MKSKRLRYTLRGFTLLEALIVVVILGVLLTVAVPSISDWIIIQRVKAGASELASDIRFSRGEAIKRNVRIAMTFRSAAGNQSCYTAHTKYSGRACNCLQGSGESCNQEFGSGDLYINSTEELKTVSLPASTKVSMSTSNNFAFLAPNGLMEASSGATVDFNGGSSRLLRVVVNGLGRPSICAPIGSRISGYTTCI